MSNSKSTGLDGIGVSTLKLAAPAVADSITYICNLSIKTKSFPEKYKVAKVTPIFKKENLEKHVYICLYDFLQDNKLLLDTQFRFRENPSCRTALITLTEEIHNEGAHGSWKLWILPSSLFYPCFGLAIRFL